MSNSYTERQCTHNYCINHDPDFGKTEEELHDVKLGWLFKKLLYLFHSHCKQEMHIKMIKFFQLCYKCGRRRDVDTMRYLSTCGCCGYHYRFAKMPYWPIFWFGIFAVCVVTLLASIFWGWSFGLGGNHTLSAILAFVGIVVSGCGVGISNETTF